MFSGQKIYFTVNVAMHVCVQVILKDVCTTHFLSALVIIGEIYCIDVSVNMASFTEYFNDNQIFCSDPFFLGQ